MSKRSLVTLIASTTTAMLAIASAANATVYNFTFVSPSESVTGKLTVDISDHEVTAITGTLSGLVNDMITGVVPNPSFPNYASTPDGDFFYTNLFNPGENPLLDQYGLLFTTAGNPGGYWNLWGSAPGAYSLYESDRAGDYLITIDGGSLDPSAVPETSTWVMMLVGLAGLGSAAYRRGRKDRLAPGLA